MASEINIVRVKDGDVSVVERVQKSVLEKLSPPPQQTKKRMRPASVPVEEEEGDVSELSDRKLMEAMFATVKSNQKQLVAFEQSLNFVHSELDTVKKENEQLKKKNAEMEGRMAAMDNRMSQLELDMAEESRKRDESEQNGRLINLEISGVPQLEGETEEDCKKIVGEIMKLVGSAYTQADVDVAHRKYAGGLICKLKSRSVRNEFYSKRFALQSKKAKDIAPRFEGVDGSDSDLYLNENLSYDRSKLMKYVRDKVRPLNDGVPKDDRIKVKTERGIVKVQNSTGNYTKIKNFSDFTRLYPDA